MASDPLAWLFGLEHFGIKFGLDTISRIVAALGHPERSFASVHVAGTNGRIDDICEVLARFDGSQVHERTPLAEVRFQ